VLLQRCGTDNGVEMKDEIYKERCLVIWWFGRLIETGVLKSLIRHGLQTQIEPNVIYPSIPRLLLSYKISSKIFFKFL
jgi:hypothetical protein